MANQFQREKVAEDHESIAVTKEARIPGFDPNEHIVHVPVARFIELECDHCLRQLEHGYGVQVDRSKGSSAIDIARNIRATEALAKGYESLLFIDSDMMFDPLDAIKLLKSNEPVIAGVYAAKKLGNGQLNASFLDESKPIRFGPWATSLYPVWKVGAGFLRIKTSLLRDMVEALSLPYCRMAERFAYPFFQPTVVQEDGETRYLGEDYSFCWRCHQMGVIPKVDTSFRLWHVGDYAYGLEEAGGQYLQRVRNFEYETRPAKPRDPSEAVPPV